MSAALSAPQRLLQLDSSQTNLLIQMLRQVRLLGKLAADLERLDLIDALPQVVQDHLRGSLALADARERVARWELNRIEWATRDHDGIRLVCMKGCAYFMLGLPMARGRIFADVDLLVAEDQLRPLEGVLNRRGWRTRELTPYDDNYYRRWTHELPPLVHVERDVEIDLHHNVLPRTARLKPDGGRLLGSTSPIEGSRCHVLADVDLALHAITHLTFNDDLVDKLRDLVDIDGLLRHFAEDDPDFWARLVSRAEELNLERALFYGLRYARELLDTPVPEDCLKRTAGWGPGKLGLMLMDALVPRALFPQHPRKKSRLIEICRWLLYVRSHWIRMPPWLLVYHLSYKFIATRLGRRHAADS